MLESLHLKDVGPAPEIELRLARRLNLITGDNGLGKSFLLDIAWWALTRSWARSVVLPAPSQGKPRIAYSYTKATPRSYSYESTYDRKTERWSVNNGRPAIPGLVLYAQVDGGFSVWDPARNYWRDNAPDRPSSYLFAPHEVWEGNTHCEGLIRDWASWQRENGEAFHMLTKVLEVLSPSEREPLVPGELRKLTVEDPKRYPTLRMPYGQDVAVTHASAGMRRIIALTYLLIWAWQEHIAAAEVRGDDPAREIIFLIDEVEAHLHPQWQRRIVPAVLKVMDALTGSHGSRVQLLTATHSPLVLASVEPLFDVKQDAWFDLDLEEARVVLRKREFVRRGDVSNWLTSEAFDLRKARSLEAESAIETALAMLRQKDPPWRDVESADQGLRAAGLPDIDPFWVRWGQFVEERKPAKRGKR
jgi:hypothetical protein